MFWRKKPAATKGNAQFSVQKEGLIELCKRLGMPDELITSETRFFSIPACFIAAYTYGEIQGSHAQLEDRRMKEWFGEYEFADGRLAHELADLRDGKRVVAGIDLAALLHSFAEMLAASIVTKQGPFAFDPASLLPPSSSIKGSEVVFAGNHGQNVYHEPLTPPISNVLVLAPGVRSLNHVDQILRLYATKETPLFQSVIIDSPFVAKLLAKYFVLRCQQTSGDGSLEKILRDRDVYTPIEGDIVPEMRKIMRSRQQNREPVAFLNLILYTSYHAPRVSPAEGQEMINHALQLLRPDGALLLGFPMTGSTEGYVSGTDLVRMALASGFEQKKAHIYGDPGQPRYPMYAFLKR